MNGATLVIESLKAHNVTTVFGYPGGAIMPVYDAIYQSGLEHILCRNEQGAAFAAVGYARASNQVGVCIATSGPGAANLITGLGDALMDSIPVIAITGNVAQELIGTDAFQEADVLGLSLACTKHSFLVQSIEELPNIIDQAFYIAQNGRPGPVLVDIPKNIQFQTATTSLMKTEQLVKESLPLSQLQQAKQLLTQSQKPLVYVGGGVGMANAVDALRHFLAQTQLPSFSTLKGLGAIDPASPYYLGMIGMHGTKAANLAAQEADLLLVFGARFDDRVTGKLSTFAPHAKVIHCDIDPAELGKLRHADVALNGDMIDTFKALSFPLNIPAWQKRIAELKMNFDFRYQENTGDSPIHPWWLLNSLSMLKKPDAIVVTDVGQHQMWAAQHMQHFSPQNFITSAGFGTMGFGLPAAIGAKKARPNSDVILITGDGSIMMNIQELATLKRAATPLKILLLENKRLGMVRQWQTLFFEDRLSQTILDDNPDFIMLANAFGIQAEKIEKGQDVAGALNRLLQSQDSYFLQVCIPENENVWPLVPPNVCNTEMLEA